MRLARKLLNIISLLTAAVFKSAESQTFSVPGDVEEGRPVHLQCTTNDFSATISFELYAVNKGGCLTGALGLCYTGIVGYQSPTRINTTVTEMIITLYNHSRDGGDWTCTYGLSRSPPVTVKPITSNSGGGGSEGGNNSGFAATVGGAVGGSAVVLGVIVIIVIVIVRRTGNIKAIIGDSVTFPCTTKVSTGMLEWRKDNISVGTIDNIVYEPYDAKKKILTVHFVENDHSGQYTCMVGKKRLQTHKLTVSNPEYTVVKGKTITLLPGMKTSYEVNKIEWKKGSEVILTVNDSTKYSGGIIEELPLTIINAQNRDAGVYICTIDFNGNIKQKTFKVNLTIFKDQNGETELDLPSNAKRHKELDPMPMKNPSEKL